MTDMEVSIQSPVDIERERLIALVRTVWEPGHYTPTCVCVTCTATRAAVDDGDLAFLEAIADICS